MAKTTYAIVDFPNLPTMQMISGMRTQAKFF